MNFVWLSSRFRAIPIRVRIAALCLALILGYGSACAGAVLFERNFTYRVAARYISPEAAGLWGVKETRLTTPDGESLVVWRVAAKPGKPTLLYFHGNGDPLAYRARRIALFQGQGFGIYMMAYRGYSGSTGAPTEALITADARLAYDALTADGVGPSEIVIYGESLGTSVAAQTAAVRPSLALILEAPFTSMVDAWAQFVPFLPVSRLLTDRFDTLSVITDVSQPIMIMHGERDRLVSFRLGRQLYDAAPRPKRFVAFPSARHANLYDHGAIDIVRAFIEDVQSGAIRRR